MEKVDYVLDILRDITLREWIKNDLNDVTEKLSKKGLRNLLGD